MLPKFGLFLLIFLLLISSIFLVSFFNHSFNSVYDKLGQVLDYSSNKGAIRKLLCKNILAKDFSSNNKFLVHTYAYIHITLS